MYTCAVLETASPTNAKPAKICQRKSTCRVGNPQLQKPRGIVFCCFFFFFTSWFDFFPGSSCETFLLAPRAGRLQFKQDHGLRRAYQEGSAAGLQGLDEHAESSCAGSRNRISIVAQVACNSSNLCSFICVSIPRQNSTSVSSFGPQSEEKTCLS